MTPSPRATFRVTWLVTTIWTTTAIGATSPNTATFGIRDTSKLAGHPTAPVTGAGLALGAGLGWTMSRGDLPRITMAVGRILMAAGVGVRDQFTLSQSMDRPLSAFSAAAAGVLA